VVNLYKWEIMICTHFTIFDIPGVYPLIKLKSWVYNDELVARIPTNKKYIELIWRIKNVYKPKNEKGEYNIMTMFSVYI
jgi:hypothetical protein